MFLSTDALPRPNLNINTGQTALNKLILRKIEDDLDIDEKISILFLMISDYTKGFQEVYTLLEKHRAQNVYILSKFIERYPDKWKQKLLEAICVIQNRQIIRKLGLAFHDLELLYLPKNRMCSRYLNVVAKCLYLLCETLSLERMKLLLQYVKSDLMEYEETLKDTDPLELHILYWIQKDYISVHLGSTMTLKNLLKHLKKFEELELLYNDLQMYEYQQDVLDIQCNSSLNGTEWQPFSTNGNILSNVKNNDIVKLSKGLCIIISEMVFESHKFETRFGTLTDCLNLTDTFKGFGFTVKSFCNLKKHEILRTLEEIPKEFGTDYDCIFVCILSHGCKGGIISSDEQEVSIETIERKFCCVELKDIIKIVVIQACQGKLEEQAQDDLRADGGVQYNIPDILAHQNFCIFMSTMQGFVSVRHKEEGSWFIQEFCNILKNDGNKLTFWGIVGKTIEAVLSKRGKLNGKYSIAQLPELRSYRLLRDFRFPDFRSIKQ